MEYHDAYPFPSRLQPNAQRVVFEPLRPFAEVVEAASDWSRDLFLAFQLD
jgi:hypothetical protein